jgi:hypothetical protein
MLFAALAVLGVVALAAPELPRAIGVPLLVAELVIVLATLLWLLGTDAWRDAAARRRAERTRASSPEHTPAEPATR